MTHPATLIVPQIARTLAQVPTWIDKTEAYAADRRFDANVLLTTRLSPDMFPLARQIGSACDTAKFTVSRLSGRTAPSHADDQKTWDEVRARVVDVLAWLESVQDETFASADTARVRFPWNPGKSLSGDDYLFHFAVPNFYFHVSMTYAILRHCGVQLGKGDFLGPLPFVEDAS